MNKSTAWMVGLFVALIVVGGLWYMGRGNSDAPNPAGIQQEGSGVNDGPAGAGPNQTGTGGVGVEVNGSVGVGTAPKTVVIRMTDAGFVPAQVTINKGDTVSFMNEGTKPVWPASAMHPTHKVYPGTDIANCSSAPSGSMFDSCKGIAPGQSWSFTFNNTGAWGFHDHVNATRFGRITVQ